ncbi:MAG TPA: ABC transporter ATP-binding protein [Capillimicrobium sp.]|jgi:branched-chain amino acid transport system ATP-binding protein
MAAPPPSPATGALEAISVSRAFAGVQALDDVTLRVRRHEVVGLIGPNGAGKTTLVNLLTGFDRPSSGQITLEGDDITGWSPVRRARHGLARTFQHGHLFDGLTVRENVAVGAMGCGASPRSARARADELLEAVGLGAQADRDARLLPHGEQRKLGVARAVASEPRYVLMDEPAAGLVEAEVPSLVELVRSVAVDHNAGVVLIDHNMALVMEVSDRIVVLDQGRVLAEGTAEEIRQNVDVASAYLGGTGIDEAEAHV